MTDTRYQSAYTPTRFWRKLGPGAKGIGRFALEKALYLYYAVQNPATPKWARRVMYGALGYFIFPLDALTVMAAALATVAFYITPEVKAQAHEKLDHWFGSTPAKTHADA
jgi:uncharacterized membrane protein YkvA (DUF1232 family)